MRWDLSFKGFSNYLSIGVLNTLIHWTAFLIFHSLLSISQALSNLGAFALAATFSFYANARYTFRAQASTRRYLLFILFMGVLSLAIGWGADRLMMPGLFTLMLFSAISLVVGFLYSKQIVFRERQS
ncbi:GtrA family protein [Pseudomonas batumici]|uniref:Bactoprenol-linked glucose translocase n=1 Tax=Pseudomonas batumici TaxID=226910 RepID=A0A0C2I430_9PSED|nr:GtrA family protein [Pseudomonas batumici]KIH81705.1 Bactoprenol-linked glucose translocase [Pseudomonas batumici]